MADDLIDLNPVSTKIVSKKKKERPVESPPDDGKEARILSPDQGFQEKLVILWLGLFISQPTSKNPTILAGALHGIIINYMGLLAAETIAKW